jgi:hypothetical protein
MHAGLGLRTFMSVLLEAVVCGRDGRGASATSRGAVSSHLSAVSGHERRSSQAGVETLRDVYVR